MKCLCSKDKHFIKPHELLHHLFHQILIMEAWVPMSNILATTIIQKPVDTLQCSGL